MPEDNQINGKSATLLKEAKKHLCEVLSDEWPRIMRCYGEALQEHENKADENSKKMVYNVVLGVRLCDTDGKTRPDASVSYGLKFSNSATGSGIDGHPEFNFEGPVTEVPDGE